MGGLLFRLVILFPPCRSPAGVLGLPPLVGSVLRLATGSSAVGEYPLVTARTAVIICGDFPTLQGLSGFHVKVLRASALLAFVHIPCRFRSS